MTHWRVSTASGLGLLVLLLGLLVPGILSQEETPSTEAPKEGEAPKNATEKPAPVLTGDPQKDYIHDPNLPRELKGYDLSDYPFYKRVPDVEFNFTCDDRHDGFYASIPHKCQVYHHCLFGVRYDFLCANYTAFDQSNFICHFANEVDCKNSELYFDRNDALYKEETTTTKKPETPNVKIIYVERPAHQRKPPGPPKFGGLRRKTTPKPDNEYYYDDYYNEDETAPVNEDYYYNDADQGTATTTTSTTTTRRPQKRPNRPLRTRVGAQSGKRVQGPRNNQNAGQNLSRQPGLGRQGPQNQNRPLRKRRRRRKKTTTTTTTTPAPEYYDEYYDDYEYYYDYPDETTTTTTTTTRPLRRQGGQGRRQSSQARRKALLQARKSQLQGSTIKKPQPLPPRNTPSASADLVYDDVTFAEEDTTFAGNNSTDVAEDFPQDFEQTPQQNARRPGAFRRPRNRRLRAQT